MPKRPIRVPATAIKIAVALLIAALTAGGIIQVTDNGPGPAPVPTVDPDSYGTGLTQPVTGESHLAEPGDVELRLPRGAGAPAAIAGCRTELNTHNFSVRTVAVREIAAHYTVSPNIPGWADVENNRAFLNLVSTQASTHFIIDAEGHCAYTVPIGLKAWTEVNGNGFTVAIEFVGTGTEGKLSPAALKQGGQVIAAVAKTENIPLQLGDVAGCSPRVPGIVDHAMYGTCGGGHHDIRPYNGTNAVRQAVQDHQALDPLIAAARAVARPHVTAAQKQAKACLAHERKIAKRHGGWSHIDPMHLRRARACKAQLA